jgi:hypothetical protein
MDDKTSFDFSKFIVPPMCKKCLYLVKGTDFNGEVRYSCLHHNGCKLKGEKEK